MISKLALAFKTKTIEFFAEEEEDDDADTASVATLDLSSAPEEVITGQRVVVLKPDPVPTRPEPDAVVSSVFAAVSSFRAAYLQLQAAHSPFDLDAIAAADRAAVSHLQRISELKREFCNPNPNSSFNSSQNRNPSFLEAQVQENQSLLRTFETVFNRLQADIDRKDSEASALRVKLKESEAENSKLARKLKKIPVQSAIEKVEGLLSVGLFDSVLRDCCHSVHQFSKLVTNLMKKAGCDFESVANSIYPNVGYVKPSHCRYAILSYICLRLFDGFDSVDSSVRPRDSLSQFIEHLMVDSVELVRRNPDCEFAKFCEKKYDELVSRCAEMESSIFGNLDKGESLFGSLRPSNPLYQSFMETASVLWSLEKLARAYEPVVEIFQVGRGKEFSMVFMTSVLKMEDYGKELCPRVGFTVVPGFRVGKTVIQCRVYLERVKETA